MIVCFDIGGTAIKAGYAHGPSRVTPGPRFPTPANNLDDFVLGLADVVSGAPERPAAVALSIAGIIDPDTRGMIVANIPCINGVDLETLLSDRLGLPVVVANDADCFALAEANYGMGRGHDIVFGAILGSGVGGGLVVNGRLVNQGGGYSGEWGHGSVSAMRAGSPPRDIPQFACGCGLSGCLDAIGSARGMERLDAHLHGRRLSSIEIVELWRNEEPEACETIAIFVELLAGPLAVLVNTTGASIVPVGGGLANASRLIEVLDEVTRKRTLRRFRHPLVVASRSGVESGLVGAAVLAGQRIGLSEERPES